MTGDTNLKITYHTNNTDSHQGVCKIKWHKL